MNFSPEFLILNFAVFAAAMLQSATGVGFSIIAGPILLWQMNSGAALQISIILNLIIVIILSRGLKDLVDKKVLARILVGGVIGLPLGFYVFLNVEIVVLKTLAILALLLTLGFVIRNLYVKPVATSSSNLPKGSLAVGLLAGLMGGSLAIPGPVPAAWMSALGYKKKVVRATIIALLLYSYAALLVLQLLLGGIEAKVYWESAFLAPAMLTGMLCGHLVVGRISERVFQYLIIIVLVVTALLLTQSVLLQA